MNYDQIDKLFRDEIDSLDSIPPQVSWDRDKSWEKLNAKLHETHPQRKVIALFGTSLSQWTYGTAAAVAILIASTIILMNKQQNHQISQSISDNARNEDDAHLVNQLAGSNPVPEQTLVIDDKLASRWNMAAVVKENPMLVQNLAFFNPYAGNNPLLMNADRNMLIEGFKPVNQKAGLNNPDIQWPAKDLANDNYQVESVPPANYARYFKKNPDFTFQVNAHSGLVKDNLNVGLEVAWQFKLRNKSNKVNQMVGFGLDNQYQFLSIGNDKGDEKQFQEKDHRHQHGINTFATLSYARNFSKNEQKPVWLGIKAGYLVQNTSATFDDKTLLLEMIVGDSENKKFTIAPQVFLTEDFKKVIPGIKLGMNLNTHQEDKDMAI